MDSSSNFFNYLPNIVKPPSHFLLHNGVITY